VCVAYAALWSCSGDAHPVRGPDPLSPDATAMPPADRTAEPRSRTAPIDPQSVGARDSWGLCRLASPDVLLGIGGTDLGFTIPAPSSVDEQQLTVLFGDTWSRAHDVCWFTREDSDDLQATLPARRPGVLSAGPPSDSAVNACADLDITIDDRTEPTTWRSIRLFRDASERTEESLLDMSFLRAPVTGFSDGSHTYGVFLRNTPAYCADSNACPTGARCSTEVDAGARIGVCGTSDDPDGVRTFCLQPSSCASGVPCVGPERGVCVADAPYTVRGPQGSYSPQWYQDDPRQAVLQTVTIASAFWPDRPQDYAVGYNFQTRKFMNVVARTVAHFDPDAPQDNDYRQGSDALLMWGRPYFFAGAGTESPLFLLYQPLQDFMDGDGRIAWAPRFFAGYDEDSGKPRWSDNEADAMPLYGVELEATDDGLQPTKPTDFDMVNHAAISWVEPLQRWVMFYGGSIPDWLRSDRATGRTPELVHPQPVPNAIHMRSASHPFGRSTLDAPADEGWTDAEPVVTRESMSFLGCDEAGAEPSFGCTVPRDPVALIDELVAWATEAAPDDWTDLTQICLAGNLALSYLYQLEGSSTSHLYGTNIIDQWTEDVTGHVQGLAPGERAVELYWNVSTWRPYQVVLMKTQLRAHLRQ